ncbi:MAG: archaetidylserine decarboxylase [Fibromonadaceae bacterium]|jgi:phosphatidylserine decarboxylase|nr:archaetidylserine decarboxylase [Fibromonadaceae bacterium]
MNSTTYCLLKLLPKNAISRAFGNFTRMRIPILSKFLAKMFANHYKINMKEAQIPANGFANIHELFIRKLKKGARIVEDNAEVVCPVDGVLTAFGMLLPNKQEYMQAKGKHYSLKSLLRNKELAQKFAGGVYATVYLAPHNYHRIHSPVSGNVSMAYYCPGKLWPVNAGSVERIEGLFSINERLITQISTYGGGEVLLVKVGATNVGRIAVEYKKDWFTNSMPPPGNRNSLFTKWEPESIHSYTKGQEIARFEMGSTIILVCNSVILQRTKHLFATLEGRNVVMGQALMV